MSRTTRILPLALAMTLAAAVPGYAQQGHATHHPDQEGVSPRGEMTKEHAGTMGGRAMGEGMTSGGMMGHMMDSPSPGMMLRHRESLGIDDAQAERLEALRDEMMSARQRVSGQAMGVLTRAQRTRLEEMKASMRAGMMKGEAMGAMMGGQDGMAGMNACPTGGPSPSGDTR